MNYNGFSTNGLKMMQVGVCRALQHDDNQPAGQEKLYGVRSFSDWKAHSDALEAELDSRRVTYTRVAW